MRMAAVNSFSRITPEIEKLSQNCMEARIDPELYTQLNVNRGLRDINGKGVLTGLTEISEIVSSKMVDGVSVPCEGELYYRGINVIDLANINSCSFIATQDLGKKYPNHSFEVLGRFDNSDIRGCNLMVI